MSPEMMSKLRRSLVEHEGYKNYPYFDTSTPANITIGIGYNLSTNGIDDEWINNQYLKDINYFNNKLSSFDWFAGLNSDRKIALIDMCFMGWQKFLEFKNFIEALSKYDYKTASSEILNSLWATQVKNNRANTIANVILTGVYNI